MEDNKTVWEARAKVYKGVYEKLDIKEAKKDILRFVQTGERRSRELFTVKCVKDEIYKVVWNEVIKEEGLFWQMYNGSLCKIWMTYHSSRYKCSFMYRFNIPYVKKDSENDEIKESWLEQNFYWTMEILLRDGCEMIDRAL